MASKRKLVVGDWTWHNQSYREAGFFEAYSPEGFEQLNTRTVKVIVVT